MLISRVQPDELELLDLLKTRVSRLMLEEIAANDNGEEIADHLAAIEAHIDEPRPAELEWCPREVLELQRWVEPDSREVASVFEREHLKRLLACTILLRHAGYMEIAQRHSLADFFLETSAASLVQLVRGAFALGPDFLPPALEFVRWLLESQPCAHLQPFAAFSALLLIGSLTGYSVRIWLKRWRGWTRWKLNAG